MNKRTLSILLHMLEDANDVILFTEQAGSFETFCENALYRKAIIMSIINIGELTKRLPDDFKTNHTEIPWRKISGMRDIAAHGYHTMDEEIIPIRNKTYTIRFIGKRSLPLRQAARRLVLTAFAPRTRRLPPNGGRLKKILCIFFNAN